ncbi:MAG: sulfur globule protein CV1 [Gammaproteobacteria bacterium]|nr:sulfur globule protein CV1 [Gammaproteobacteria bacterium]
MTKIPTTITILLLVFSTNSNAWWGGMNSSDPWDENDWPVWSPMFWMEEMSDEFDNNNKWNNRYGNGYRPYGYGQPMPYYPQPYPYYAPTYPQLNTDTTK